MKRFLLLLALTATALFAEVQHRYLDKELLASGIKIIDIRTPGEWRQTGLIKGSIPIMFFDENGRYDVPRFMKALQAEVKPDKTFALICRSGSRTRIVADFLSKNFGYKVIDLKGGIGYAIGQKFPLVPYSPK